MYFLSNSAPEARSIIFISALSLRLPDCGSATPFDFASVSSSLSICWWSLAIFCANSLTSALCALAAAALPPSISFRFACASCFIAAASALSIFWSDFFSTWAYAAGTASTAPSAMAASVWV